MVKRAIRIARYFATIVASGGGNGGGKTPQPAPKVYVSQILNDPDTDGDIAFTAPSTFTISSDRMTRSVLAGIDPISGDEYRGFLSCPLAGPGGCPVPLPS